MAPDWFEQLFGFVEAWKSFSQFALEPSPSQVDYDSTKQQLRVHPSEHSDGLLLDSLVNKASYCVGTFGTPSS